MQTKSPARAYFETIQSRVYSLTDISSLLNEHRREWSELGHNTYRLVEVLLKEGVLRRAEFKSKEYPSIIRYLRGTPSPHELAISLRRGSFLCHKTALVLHGLEPHTTTIYVNKEQANKPVPEGITQEGVNRAFRNGQRQSKYIFRYEGSQFVLVSGKNTGRAGVISTKISDGATVDTTDLERTLIDVVVRPAYAGGIKRVFSVYKRAAARVDIDHMIALLQKVSYAYPYHQSIGFLLYRAGRPERDCKKFKEFGLEFDFFLDYGLKHPAYDGNWRLYYPSHLR